jgi:hypothetical protein
MTLNDKLAELGLTTRNHERHPEVRKKHILNHAGEILFTGNAIDTWEWLKGGAELALTRKRLERAEERMFFSSMSDNFYHTSGRYRADRERVDKLKARVAELEKETTSA